MPEDLPPGIHSTVLTGTDVVTGGRLAYTIVWADRSYSACPRCAEPVDVVVEDCPANLNEGAGQGGQVEPWSAQHGCGEWLSVQWFTVGPGETVAGIAAHLAYERNSAIAQRRDGIRVQLVADLTRVLARIDSGNDGSDVETGSETVPGVYHDGSVWIAWDWDPVDAGVTIAVTDLDIPEEQVAAVPREHTVVLKVKLTGPDGNFTYLAGAVWQSLSLPDTVTTVEGRTYTVTGWLWPPDQENYQH